jgi:protein phosphatase
LLIKSVAVSQIGKVREHNEDAILADEAKGLWIVADGMGGHACGEVASQLAIDVVADKASDGEKLVDAISSAHEAILEQAGNNPEQQGMGTTIVAAALSGTGFNIAWVGDSRAYLFNPEQDEVSFRQLSVDHSFVQDMVERQVLTAEEAIDHPQSNLINRSLGMAGRFLGVDDITLYPKNSGILFLCSDGVTDYISSEQLESQFNNNESIEDISEGITEAVLNSEAADNFSYILISFEINKLTKIRNTFRRNNSI